MTRHSFVVQPAVRRIRFIRRGEGVNPGNVPPGRTVLERLRADPGSASEITSAVAITPLAVGFLMKRWFR